MKKGNQKRIHWFAHLVNKIICIVKHKKHTKCLNWYIVTFRVKYWFMLNLISATYLKQVRTGATKSWKSKRFSKETAGRTFCKWLNQLALFSIKKKACHREAKVLQVKMGQGSLICKKTLRVWNNLQTIFLRLSWKLPENLQLIQNPAVRILTGTRKREAYHHWSGTIIWALTKKKFRIILRGKWVFLSSELMLGA